LIASLIGLDPEKLQKPINLEPWKQLLKQWANKIDMIIFLDAQDEDLIHRISNREKEHLVKEKSLTQKQRFFSHNREIFRLLIENILLFNPQINIIEFNTSKISQKSLLDELSSILSNGSDINKNQHSR